MLKLMQDTVCFFRDEAMIMAAALEELLEYRQIGTVEEFRNTMDTNIQKNACDENEEER